MEVRGRGGARTRRALPVMVLFGVEEEPMEDFELGELCDLIWVLGFRRITRIVALRLDCKSRSRGDQLGSYC